MIGKFFYIPKNKRFSIPFRYYDPDKEEMETREQRIKHELGIHEKKEFDASYRATLKGSFRNAAGGHAKSVEDARRKSNTRLIFLILILAFVFYLLFFQF